MKKYIWRVLLSLGLVSTAALAIDVNGELKRALLEKLNADPTGYAGRIYYDTANNVAKFYNGTAWRTIADTASALSNPMTTQGDIIYGGASGAATRLAAGTANQVLHSGSTPSWSAVVDADFSGQLSMAKGGTNKNATAVNGGLVYSDADSFEITSAGTAQQWVLSGGAGAPTMSNTTTTAKTIDGSADAVQLTVQGHSTQSSDILVVENSAGSDRLTVSGGTAGVKVFGATDGVACTNSAMDGLVGECFVATSGSTPTTTLDDLVTIDDLPAGQWMIWGSVVSNDSGSNALGLRVCIDVSADTCSLTGPDTQGRFACNSSAGTGGNNTCSGQVGPYFISHPGTQDYFLNVASQGSNFTGSTTNNLRAIRIH